MNRLSWDEYFGLMVQVVSLRSGDAETKVGAIIVDEKNRIVATGYNGTPYKTNLPNTRPEKYPYMVHAEENAILHAQRDLTNCKIYVLGLTPCNVCARMMIQRGIIEVIVVNPISSEGKDWNFEHTFKMFEQVDMGFRQVEVPNLDLTLDI